jgi:hypothetical protein
MMFKYSGYSGLLGTPPGDEDETPMGKEMKILYKKPMKYNNNVSAVESVRNASKLSGVSPELLFSSAFQEGMNKAIAKPDEISQSYAEAKIGNDYPVDGFYSYGLDTFGDKYEQLKPYLPKDFDKRVKFYKGINEKKQAITTAAFRNDSDALVAKAAFIRMEQNNVDQYFKAKGVTLDDDARNYFTLVRYNTSDENAKKMMDKYAAAKDKKAFIEKGDAQWMNIHKNIAPRMKNMKTAKKLLDEK